MKKFLFIILFLLFSIGLKAQDLTDTLGILNIKNSLPLAPDTLMFDITLERNSDVWHYWANGTYQFRFDTEDPDLDYNEINFEYVQGTTELNPEVFPGLPPYEIYTQVFDNRFSVFIIGPERLDQFSKYFNIQEEVKLGTFILSSTEGKLIPQYLEWMRPLQKWQGNAFKVENTNEIPEYLSFFGIESNDNVEMTDRVSNYTLYNNDDASRPEFAFDYFEADYAGIKKVTLTWRTLTEVYNRGFKIYRAPRVDVFSDPENLDYDHLVATYEQGAKYSEIMDGSFYSKEPNDYVYNFDTVEYRGGQYCYKLTYVDRLGVETTLAYDCLNIPNAVISEATASPNPFRERSKIDYKLEDEVYLTAVAYDAIGKFIKYLKDPETGEVIKNLQKTAGDYYTFFSASDLASQGLYTIVLRATPISDPSIEVSRAVVKTQYLRD